MASADFSYSVERDGQVLRVALIGELDALAAGGLHEALRDADLRGVAEVRVDCSGLTYLESAGIAVLVKAHASVTAAGAVVILEHMRPAQRRVLEIVGLTEHLHLEP